MEYETLNSDQINDIMACRPRSSEDPSNPTAPCSAAGRGAPMAPPRHAASTRFSRREALIAVTRMAMDPGKPLPVTWQAAPEIMAVAKPHPSTASSDGGELQSPTACAKRGPTDVERNPLWRRAMRSSPSAPNRRRAPGPGRASRKNRPFQLQAKRLSAGRRASTLNSVEAYQLRARDSAPCARLLPTAPQNDVRALQRCVRSRCTKPRRRVRLAVLAIRWRRRVPMRSPPSTLWYSEVLAFLEQRIACSSRPNCGHRRRRSVLPDPGHLARETLAHNLVCSVRSRALWPWRRPVLIGVSRGSAFREELATLEGVGREGQLCDRDLVLAGDARVGADTRAASKVNTSSSSAASTSTRARCKCR